MHDGKENDFQSTPRRPGNEGLHRWPVMFALNVLIQFREDHAFMFMLITFGQTMWADSINSRQSSVGSENNDML